MNFQAPKGTKDIFGEEVRAWQWLESHIRETCNIFGFGEIRTPIFEHTELFLRGMGDTTDVVQKEMYTFKDKGDRSITLRPEGTAGTARAFVEQGMYNDPMPAKLYYIGPNFRYENPQAGRFRQHHQFGIEAFGSPEPAMEAEVISLGYYLLQKLGITGVTVCINSLGCKECHGEYRNRLKAFVGDNLNTLCEECRKRFNKNPLRALDCKVEKCRNTMSNAPSILESLDEECKTHFETLQTFLKDMEIPFIVNPKIVRGLDYYTRTVFEFTAEGLPTVIGGGRYDNLIEEIGSGISVPAVGFGMGMDRLLILLKNQNLLPENNRLPCRIYIGHAGEAGYQKAKVLVHALRNLGTAAESDLLKRSVKAQMKYAGKRSADFSMIIGDNEIEANKAKIKNMETGEQSEVALEADFIRAFIDKNQ
ncbi:MAG: histidine--tRNA ligase [Defluviitaleaceae bacterium]|nr:histidine--tRNA ligase [Defluviitaleaceae bacterium]